MKINYKNILFTGAFLCLALGLAYGEFKFPPPEFETNYVMPVMQKPPARPEWLAYLDILLLVGVILLSAWASLKRRSRNIIILISMFSLFYFGFYKEGCICPIGAVQDVALALTNPQYYMPFSAVLIFIIPLTSALFFGRAYCGGACPHGALQDLLLLKEIKIPRWLDRSLSMIAYIYLGLAVLFAVTDSAFLICKYDPFVPFFRLTGPFYMFITGGIFVLLSLFIGRPYCRFICPYGALLKPLSLVSREKVTITPGKCIVCNLCEDSCPFGAINKPEKPAKRKLKNGIFIPLMFILALLAGGFLGNYTGGFCASYNKDIKMAKEIHAYNEGKLESGSLSDYALEYLKGGESSELIYNRAAGIRNKFKTGGAVLGVWVIFVMGLQLLYSVRKPKREIYEPDGARCLSCGRCFMDCPIERQELIKKDGQRDKK